MEPDRQIDRVLALSHAPQHERAWASGAAGEEAAAAALAKHSGNGVVVLHDRAVPGRRVNIDHIAVAPSGVWVIDTKRYRGGKVAVDRPLLGRPQLKVGGRDKTKLVDGLHRQVALVRAALAAERVDAPLHGTLCFVDAHLPLFRTLSFEGFPLLDPQALAKRLDAGGPLSREDVTRIAAHLAERFPRA